MLVQVALQVPVQLYRGASAPNHNSRVKCSCNQLRRGDMPHDVRKLTDRTGLSDTRQSAQGSDSPFWRSVAASCPQ